MNLQIRCAEAADYDSTEAIMQQVHAMHVHWRPDIYKPAAPVYSKAYYDKLMCEKRLLVAELDGQVVGLLSFVYRHVESDKQVTRNILFVDDLAVKEAFRGRGIGSRLLAFARDKVQQEHLDGLELQVNAMNHAARKLYEKLGFTEKSINLELR